MAKKKKTSQLVYSTEFGKMCLDCANPISECNCRKKIDDFRSGGLDGVVRVSRQTKGRKGRCVTVITGIDLSDEELQTLAKSLKQKCGAGGTVDFGVIEIQGDQRTSVIKELQERGYKVKRAGG
ncbi:MAG: translation initiation factor Sui1 [Candidatus Omnitrophica bacterium]|nr:translation initiation factor Sui1 [Candidatus Omnitrophota bacterium]